MAPFTGRRIVKKQRNYILQPTQNAMSVLDLGDQVAIYVSQLSSDRTTAAAPTVFKTLTNVGGTAATIHGTLGANQTTASTDCTGSGFTKTR